MHQDTILSTVLDYIQNYNQASGTHFAIDSIRINFQKQHKLERLNSLGSWRTVKSSSKIAIALKQKLQKRISQSQVSSARYLNANVCYYNLNTDAPKYRHAQMIIFGMRQYNPDMTLKPFDYALIDEIVAILRPQSIELDICLDFTHKPNIGELSKHFKITAISTGKGTSYYVNNPNFGTIKKFYIYDKMLKNSLQSHLWRLEAQIIIANTKELFIPLDELLSIYEIIQGVNH